VVIGDKERDEKTVTYRVYGNEKQVTVSLADFVQIIRKSIDEKAHY